MTKYTFFLNNNPSTFFTTNKSKNYSKILDDLIAADIKKNNTWLFGNTANDTAKIKIKFNTNTSSDNIINAILNDASDFSKACKFLENYGKFNMNPYKKDTIYYLSNGTPFYFTDDYITIGFETFYFYEFGSMDSILAKMNDNMKKTICTIYTDGLKITIKK